MRNLKAIEGLTIVAGLGCDHGCRNRGSRRRYLGRSVTNGSLICLSGIAEGKHYQKTFGEAK